MAGLPKWWTDTVEQMNKTIAEEKEKQKEKKREHWLRQEKQKEEDKEKEELRLYQKAVEKEKGKQHGNKIRLPHEDKLRLEKKMEEDKLDLEKQKEETKRIEEEKAMMIWQERQAYCRSLITELKEDQAEYERMEARVFAKRGPELWCKLVVLVLHKYYDDVHCLSGWYD